MQVVYPVGSSMVYLTLDRRWSLVFGSKLFTDCSLFCILVGPGNVYGPIQISRGQNYCGPQAKPLIAGFREWILTEPVGGHGFG
jgi:hypothetical protein